MARHKGNYTVPGGSYSQLSKYVAFVHMTWSAQTWGPTLVGMIYWHRRRLLVKQMQNALVAGDMP